MKVLFISILIVCVISASIKADAPPWKPSWKKMAAFDGKDQIATYKITGYGNGFPGPKTHPWVLAHYQGANRALLELLKPMNGKLLCVVIPQPEDDGTYGIAWFRVDDTTPPPLELKEQAADIVQSYFWGEDYDRIAKKYSEQPNQAQGLHVKG